MQTEGSAAQELDRRRRQNALAQKRFRDRKRVTKRKQQREGKRPDGSPRRQSAASSSGSARITRPLTSLSASTSTPSSTSSSTTQDGSDPDTTRPLSFTEETLALYGTSLQVVSKNNTALSDFGDDAGSSSRPQIREHLAITDAKGHQVQPIRFVHLSKDHQLLSFQCLTPINAIQIAMQRIGIPDRLLNHDESVSCTDDSIDLSSIADAAALKTHTTRYEDPISQAIVSISWSEAPSNMHPTLLQLTIRHHPYLDILFASAMLRDRYLLLVSLGALDEADFCQLLLDHPTTSGKAAPWRIWGDDTMDEDSWEFDETFVRRYPALFDREILKRTNWWRKKRDLAPILVDWTPS